MTSKNILLDQQRLVSETVRDFIKPVSEAAKSGDDAFENKLWQSWNDLVKATSVTTYLEQDYLINFLQELRKEPAPKKENGEAYKIWGSPMEWKELTLFGPVLRESWDLSAEVSDPKKAEEWVNLNGFVARMTRMSKPSDPLDFSLYGIWTLRTALEDPSPEKKLAPAASLKAAAVWMVYASRTLRDRSVNEQAYGGKTAREGESLRGKEWRGCSKERWAVWSEQLSSAREKCEDGETVELVGKAIQEMQAAEEK